MQAASSSFVVVGIEEMKTIISSLSPIRESQSRPSQSRLRSASSIVACSSSSSRNDLDRTKLLLMPSLFKQLSHLSCQKERWIKVRNLGRIKSWLTPSERRRRRLSSFLDCLLPLMGKRRRGQGGMISLPGSQVID